MQEKISSLKLLFESCSTREAIYSKIMELGKKLAPFNPEYRTLDNLVSGCQSVMHLHAFEKEGKIYFTAESNALISSGLAYMVTFVYSGESPETILTKPPHFLEEMGIYSSLSLNRSNGLSQLFLKMRKEAVKHLSK